LLTPGTRLGGYEVTARIGVGGIDRAFLNHPNIIAIYGLEDVAA
jgi:hypothetical protein